MSDLQCFLDAAAAYEILSDDTKRAAYDLRVNNIRDARGDLEDAAAEAILAAHDAIEKRKERWIMQLQRAQRAHSEAHSSPDEPRGCVQWAREGRCDALIHGSEVGKTCAKTCASVAADCEAKAVNGFCEGTDSQKAAYMMQHCAASCPTPWDQARRQFLKAVRWCRSEAWPWCAQKRYSLWMGSLNVVGFTVTLGVALMLSAGLGLVLLREFFLRFLQPACSALRAGCFSDWRRHSRRRRAGRQMRWWVVTLAGLAWWQAAWFASQSISLVK